MILTDRTVRVARPPREVLHFIADFRNLPQWDDSVASAEKLTEGPMETGARFALRMHCGLRELPLHSELLRLSSPHAATLRSDGPGLTLVDEFRVEADGASGATLSWKRELHVDGGWRRRLLPTLLRRASRRAAEGLRRALRREARPRLGLVSGLADRLLLPGAARFTQQGFRLARLPAISTRADGLHVAITGATGGIGEAAALRLARAGAQLTVIGRDGQRLRALQRRLRVDSGSRATMIEADLLDLNAVVGAAKRLRAGPPVNVLINNAGALFGSREESAQGIERALCLNLAAPWLLMKHLLPGMPAGGRVINVVSGGMYLTPVQPEDLEFRHGRYDGAVAYARAKRALALLSMRLARAWPEHAVHCMHPGWVDTPGVRTSLPRFYRTMRPFLRDADAGADTIVWLALSPHGAHSRHGVWLDRLPHALDVLPSTRCNDDAVDTLDGELRALVGPWLSAGTEATAHSV